MRGPGSEVRAAELGKAFGWRLRLLKGEMEGPEARLCKSQHPGLTAAFQRASNGVCGCFLTFFQGGSWKGCFFFFFCSFLVFFLNNNLNFY